MIDDSSRSAARLAAQIDSHSGGVIEVQYHIEELRELGGCARGAVNFQHKGLIKRQSGQGVQRQRRDGPQQRACIGKRDALVDRE